MTRLTPHYEIRQIIIARELPGAPVILNVGIRYLDANREQVGPESGQDVTLDDVKLNSRASARRRPVWDEDDVLEEAKEELGSVNVKLVDPPAEPSVPAEAP